MTQPHGITTYRVNDLIALQKQARGDWTINFGTGEISNRKGDEIKGRLNPQTGYLEIKTSENGADVKMLKHRVIYICGHGILSIKLGQELEIDHIDGNKLNNSLSNLRMVTPSENCLNPNTLMRGGKAPHSKLTDETAEYIRSLYVSGGFTCRKLAQMFGLSPQSVESLIHNRTYVSDSPAAVAAQELIENKPRGKKVPSEAAA
ncbi:HNH endonuclease signature motif containing protein [Methanorbis furvi]|uniref:HNH nuclease domain-containing protein n=1 Tax=Methanorbis furvi TaxID=3028299 RepID=A0AAE4SBD7_9EURY|nr:hypothetical protein [Methanocorpusculaceae archaeon Ag1]